MSDVTSIAAYATNLSNAQLKQQVGMAVAKKSLDAARQQGQAAIELLQAAAQVAPAAPGKGERLNVVG